MRPPATKNKQKRRKRPSSIFFPTRGQIVEVSSNEDGFVGSYYEARVVSLLDNGLYVVQYKTLLEDDDSLQPLSETVYPNELRPIPPPFSGAAVVCAVGQRVDAFDNDGWWVGVVTSASRDSASASVYFEPCQQQLTYPLSRLRVHQEWINGKWVPSK